MPVNKERCGMPAWTSAQVKRPVPSKPEMYSASGTERLGNVPATDKPHDYEGPGKVVTPDC